MAENRSRIITGEIWEVTKELRGMLFVWKCDTERQIRLFLIDRDTAFLRCVEKSHNDVRVSASLPLIQHVPYFVLVQNSSPCFPFQLSH